MESLELFGAQGPPEFKERDEKLRAEKAKRLEPAVEAAMKRRVDSAPEMPEGYTMDALPKQLIKAAGGDELLDQIASDTSTGKPRSQLENLLAREA